jgi:hypothetical protein
VSVDGGQLSGSKQEPAWVLVILHQPNPGTRSKSVCHLFARARFVPTDTLWHWQAVLPSLTVGGLANRGGDRMLRSLMPAGGDLDAFLPVIAGTLRSTAADVEACGPGI